MKLEIIEGIFAIGKLNSVPAELLNLKHRSCLFLGITDKEISLVCEEERMPADRYDYAGGYRAFRVKGTLDFSLTGILASITQSLSRANISVFAVSTFDTDYILVKDECLKMAVKALEEEGYQFN